MTTIRFRHPAFLAAQVLGLDQISGGRAAVAIGAGEPFHSETIGEARWTGKETGLRLEEQAATLDGLLRGEPTERTGSFYSTSTGTFFDTYPAEMPQPTTKPRPPLFIAAHGPKGMRTAARYADAWNCMGGQPYAGGPKPAEASGGRSLAEALAETRRLIDGVDEACEDVGRDPASLQRTVLAIYPEPDPFASLDAFDAYVGAYEEIGISAITFYWPPIDTALEDRTPSPDEESLFESICAERMGAH